VANRGPDSKLMPWFQTFFAVDENGDGPVVMNLDQHILLERLSLLGWGSVSKAGAASFSSASKEGKLTYYQYLATDIQY